MAVLFVVSFASSFVVAHEPAVGRIDNPPFPIEARSINASSRINACGVGSFAFALTNPGSYEETLDLGADPSFDTAYFSENPVSLAPGQSRTVALFVVPPCEAYGTWNVELLVRSRSDMSQVRTLIGELEVLSDGIVEIAPGVERIRVDYNRSGSSISIRNVGAIDANYELTAVGPSWVFVRPQNMSIPSGETGIATLISNPPESSELGTYRTTVFARSRETGVEYGKVFQVVLSPFTEQELRWNALKPWLALALVLLLMFLFALIILIIYLVRTRESRNASASERAAVRAAASEAKRAQRMEALKDKWTLRIKDWFKRQLGSEFVLIRRSDGSIVRRWPVLLLKGLGFVVLSAAVAFLMWWFWASLLPFIWLIWLIIALAFLAIIVVWVLSRMALRRWMGRFTSRELDDIRQQARDELEEEYVLADRAAIVAAKRQGCWLGSALLWLACLISVGFAVAGWKYSWWLGSWFVYAFAIFIGLALLFAILAIVVYRRCKSRYAFKVIPVMESGEIYSMQTGWRDGVTEVGVRPNVDREGVVLSCRRHDDNPVFVGPDGVPYQFVEVRASGLSDKDVDEALVKFKVRRKWLSDSRCDDKDIALMRYDSAKSRWVKADEFESLGSDGKFNGYSASISGLGYYVILARPKKGAFDGEGEDKSSSSSPGFFSRWFNGKDREEGGLSIADEIAARKAAREAARQAARDEERRRREEEARKKDEERRRAEMEALLAAQDRPKRRWWRYVLWTLLILLLLVALFAVIFLIDPSLMPPWLASALGISQAGPVVQPINETGDASLNGAPTQVGIPDQVWLRNMPHEMDLSRWFTDPDRGDVLTFSHTPMGNIFVSYNGSAVTLTPKKDWEGEDQTVFTATDKGGLSVQSNSVRMVVQHGQNTPVEDARQFFKDYWMYLFVALFVLAIVIISVIMMRRSDDDES